MDGYNINQVVEFGNFDQFKLMADLDINLIDSVEDPYGRTPLIICSKFKNSPTHTKIAEYLLEAGCDLNIKADPKWENWTALCTACYYGNSDMVKLILSSKSNLDIEDEQIQKACQVGIDRSSTECVNLILNELENRQIYELKQNIEKKLQKAVYTNDIDLLNKTINEMKENNFNIKQFMNSTSIISHTLLDRACRNSNPELVKTLIDFNIIAKPNYYTKYSPLYIVSHMGHYEIAQLLIKKYPHLIQVETIEKFLPYHAVCSQGHLDILKLLINFNLKSIKSDLKAYYSKYYVYHLERIFSNPINPGQKYQMLFDLNSLDANDQSALYHAVIANKYNICDYLLKLRVAILPVSKIAHYEKKNQKIKDLFANESFHLSVSSSKSYNDSFLDQLKSVFLDAKSYDPYYTINYSATEETKAESESSDSEPEDDESPVELFNPINVNQYSKFGLTCLHESIRAKNTKIADLLIKNGADPNLPVLDSNMIPISNSLNEALKTQDDKLFYLILKNYSLTNEIFIQCLNACLSCEFGFRAVSYLLRFKIVDDTDSRITKGKNSIFGLSFNLADLSLPELYETWILNSSLNYKADLVKSSSINAKKFHFSTITKIDLSNNSLETLPMFLFAIETLKHLRLSQNKLKSLPTSQTQYDNITLRKSWTYSSHQLEELDLDHNMLSKIPSDIFALKSLRRLNLSYNLIEHLPVEIWQSSLNEINLSYNRLSNLPVVASCANQLRGRLESKRSVSANLKPIIKPKEINETVHNYNECRVEKANFWSQNSAIFTELELDDEHDKKGKKNSNESKIYELNLSHNSFKKVPECLSCVVPKLCKLNLSHNLIESMGAISDYPVNLKFIDLSNNLIDDTGRLLNSSFLKFIDMYLLGKSVELKKLDFSLLDNQFCYLNLSSGRARPREKSIQVNLRSSSNRRRARSQSRNPARSSVQINPDKKLPFDLYLMNFKYRRVENESDAFDFDEMCKHHREEYLNSQNIQIFIEQLCPHKRHIKLESLKSLNLSCNKINKLDLMFDLSGDSGKCNDESDVEDETKTSKLKSSFVSKNEERANCISKLLYPNLTHLDISNNLIKSITSSVSYLENLSHLNASSNFELQKISPKLGWLTKLWNLDLKSCPNIKDVQLDVLIKQKTKTSDVLGYLKSILDNSRPYNRVKLMFVGVQAIGKTTLLNKLRDETGHSSSKTNLSTVGIEINEWTYERAKNAKPIQDINVFMEQNYKNFGPITFRTWDFAGQKEYYTTHQYFISKRAVYLVCWKMTEEEKGINEIHHWLSNIQTRAPGSPCIIVGTHQDQLSRLKNFKDISNSLQRKIYEKFILPNSDSETTSAAYPPIFASIEISSKTGYNIKLLARLIYDVVAQMKVPGTKDQLLLEQKIPSTYIALEECVCLVAKKLRSQSQNPVLRSSEYISQIHEAINYLYPDEDHGKLAVRFRDNNEILQATQFLHDNGILIHYNDVALNDLFFLDPQWLCDILSTVVAIREINPFAAKGIMKITDLQVLFKGSKKLSSESEEIMSYITDLLGKFELALTWDNEHLLIPSLLPSEPMLKYSNQDIRINIMSKQKLNSILSMNNLVQSTSYSGSLEITNQLFSGIKLANSYSQNILANKLNLEFLYECKPIDENESLRRLYTLTYLPSGFFSRLIVRILCDSFLKDSLFDLIEIEQCDKLDFKLVEFLSQEAEWKCWQTGLELKYMDYTLFRVKEIIQDPLIDLDQSSVKKNIFVQNSILFKDCENELKLKTINKQFCSFIECYASLTSFKISKISNGKNENDDVLINIKLNRQIIAKIFALIIEIIDSLLEDWYPDLGTRFMQDSKGDYLVTRLAPCCQCLHDFNLYGSNSDTSKYIDELDQDELEKLKSFDEMRWIYCFMLDDICYSVLKNSKLICVKHGEQIAREVAPDLAFEDIESKYLIIEENLKIEKLLGRGSFGSVFSGSLFTSFMNQHVMVAVKILESINSRPSLSEDEQKPLTKNSSNFWNHRKSIRLAAKAYSIARQEIAILSSLKHENIVSMMGLCIKPLAIILELAPLGNLKDLILAYKKKSQRLNPCVIQQVCVQVSSCLVYLHSNKIIYRDLKADNVLVWKFPLPDQLSSSLETQIKLADYSISRCVLPTGTKGFAGTPGFMAPEILKYNGEESYSEKVDCFSFAMVLYELITLKHPYEGQEQIKDIVLNGGRPLVKTQDLTFPSLMLDLMCLCWLDNPNDRPSAEQIYKYAKSYEFSHLMDVTILEDYKEAPLIVTCVNQENDDFEVEERSEEDDDSDLEEIEEEDLIDIWVVNNKEESVTQIEILTYENKLNCTNRKKINLSNNIVEACCYLEKANQMWFVDSNKSIFVYCCKTYKKLNQYILDINPETSGRMIAIHPIESCKQIILVTTNGIIIYLYLNESTSDNNCEFKYFIKELGINCYSSLLIASRSDNRIHDLWLGSSNSEVFIYSLKYMNVTSSYLHTSSHHYVTNSNMASSPFEKNSQFNFSLENTNDTKDLNVVLMKVTQTDAFFLWSYVFPGSTIYLWNYVSKKIMSAYNCKKSFEDGDRSIDRRDFRVVDIEFLNSYLFCAINNGAVLVLKRLTLTPIQVFSSHVHHLYKLCSIQFETRMNIWSKHNKQNMTSQVKKTQSMLLSMGRALAPIHEDVYLSNRKYRTDALQNYANCLILNAWNCNHD